MKSKYIFSLLLLITLLSFFSSCKSTPQPIQDSSISTKKEEIKKDGELDKKEKEALAARNEAIENEADKKFTSMFEAADKRLDIARKERKREQAIKGFDEAITMYNTLTNLSKALQCKKELEELGFLDKEPEKIKKANELYDSASEKYQKDSKASLKDSSDSLSIYETLCDKAYFNLVGNIKEAAKKAKEMELTVSIDLNYRKKLWSKKEAQEKTALIMPYVDICMGNEEDAANMLGFDMKGSEPEKGIISLETYYDIFKEMKEKFGFKCIATSLRESYSASENAWQGLLYDGKNFYSSEKYKITLVDRLGGGDAFSAALIYSLLKGKEKQKAIDFAVAASALKQTIKGDFNLSYIEDIERLVEGDAMGRIIR